MAHERPDKEKPSPVDGAHREDRPDGGETPDPEARMSGRPRRFRPRFPLALLVGVLGALVFTYLGVPLAWMLGPMAACTIAAMARAPIAVSPAATPPMLVVIGVLLGSGFDHQTVAAAYGWLVPLAGMAVLLVIWAALCTIYFRLAGKLDFATAYFSAMPGGVVEMIMIGEEKGGDGRTIALIHASRLLLVVFAVPFLMQLTSPHVIPAIAGTSLSVTDLPLEDYLWLALIAVLGAALGHFGRLPGKYLLGPTLVSAALHLAGVTEVVPPFELVLLAQLILGTAIGCRFADVPTTAILRVLCLSVGSTVILLSTSVAMAAAIAWASGFDLRALMLAYSPGGLAEMSLVALSLQIEVAFVAFLHIARVLMVLASASIAFAMIQRLLQGRERP